nr:hypothetical protein [Tanacetum cinerariifolium]
MRFKDLSSWDLDKATWGGLVEAIAIAGAQEGWVKGWVVWRESRVKARVDSSKDEQSLGEDASKQGREIHDIDADEDITLVNDQNDAKMFVVNDLHSEEVFVETEVDDKE